MKDDGPSVETLGIFYETVSLVHLEVRSDLTSEVTNISKCPNNFLCTILKPTEDDELSFEKP
jgi:hypothetical protein